MTDTKEPTAAQKKAIATTEKQRAADEKALAEAQTEAKDLAEGMAQAEAKVAKLSEKLGIAADKKAAENCLSIIFLKPYSTYGKGHAIPNADKKWAQKLIKRKIAKQLKA